MRGNQKNPCSSQRKWLQSMLGILLCAMLLITGLETGTVQAAKKKIPLTVGFQGETVTLAEDVSEDIHITPKDLEKKWGKPKKKTEGTNTSYIWEKGKTSIRYSLDTESFTMIFINIKDKNGEFLGVKGGMKKATAMKKLKKALGVKEADIQKEGKEERLYLPLAGVTPCVYFENGKVSLINFCGYITEEPAKIPVKVKFGKKTITLTKDTNGGKYITLKKLKEALGKPTDTGNDDIVYWEWKKGESTISLVRYYGESILVIAKDKNMEILGIKVGMKKETALKKLKKLLGCSDEDFVSTPIKYEDDDIRELIELPIPGMLPDMAPMGPYIEVKDGKVTEIYFHTGIER